MFSSLVSVQDIWCDIGDGPFETGSPFIRWFVSKNLTGFFRGKIQIQAEEFVASLIDEWSGLSATCSGNFLDDQSQDPGQLQRNVAGGFFEAGQFGRRADEIFFGDSSSIGDIKDFPDRFRLFGGQENGGDEIFDVDAVQSLVTLAEIAENSAFHVGEHFGQNGTIALTVNKAWAYNRSRQ